ncbi:tail fiber protein [Pseudomonas phage PFP1]|uniref:Tail fiber protein n=1 Tax=Pseudomonas phage PFP1 TaxID=2201462 RepID=A0A2Z4QIY6_9CAUD|nr:tail fiber protein [Pseudomonas phage PFP1]AWY10490.1 tail fiber protein [Pseudomonas phage PFP1]
MALAPKTVLTYPLNGTNRDFTIPFEYLARKFVQVTLIGTDRKLLTLNIDYRFTLRTIITLTKNWGPADGYERIEIRRYTSATERLVDFSDGSILRAYDLNTSQVQSLHIAEEGRDVASDTIGVNNDGDLDARGRKIVNLADATSDGDAVTLRQEKAWSASALNQANRAEQQANASANSAAQSFQDANRAGSQAAAAADANTKAQDAAVRSYGDANRSTQFANESSRHAGNSAQSANEAAIWAAHPENVPAQGNKYSSYHYSRKSADSAAQSFQDANRSKSEADRAAVEAGKLGNANDFMSTLGGINHGTGLVSFKSSYGLLAKSVTTHGNVESYGNLISRGSVVGVYATSDSTGPEGNAHFWFYSKSGASKGIIYSTGAAGEIVTQTGSGSNSLIVKSQKGVAYIGDHQIYTNGNLNPALYLVKHNGTHSATKMFAANNPWTLQPTDQNYSASIELREAAELSTKTGGDIVFAPGLSFHYGGYNIRKLVMSSDSRLKYGTHNGGFRNVKVTPSAQVSLWAGSWSLGQTINIGAGRLGRHIHVWSSYGSLPRMCISVQIPIEDGAAIVISSGGGHWTVRFYADGRATMIDAGVVQPITEVTMCDDEAN